MAERELLVRILGDDRDLQRALKNTDRNVAAIDNRTASFGRNIGRAFGAAGITVGAAGLFSVLGDSIDAASDLNEQLSRTEVVLGDSAGAMIAWSETTATSMGISQRAALAAGATFAGLFQTVGVAQDEAGQFSRVLVQLAADLASLGNSTPEEALIALRSGLAGESEPLRRYNIFLNEATVAQRALAESGKENVKQLTLQEKTLARYSLILEQGAVASGNFQDTSSELANQQRILRANLDDLSTDIGNTLVPVLTDAAGAANLLFEALDRMRGVDFSPGFDFPDPPSWLRGLALAPVSPLLAGVAVGQAVAGRFGPQPGEETIPGDISRRRDLAKQIADEAREAARAATEAGRETRRSAREFAAFITGQGLKLDRATLTASLEDDLAVLRAIEAAIRRRIAAQGRTFELVNQLTQVQLQEASLIRQQAADVARAREEAARIAKEAADRREELEREAEEAERRALERARARRIGRQFERLGLTAAGEERVPGIEALGRRRESLEEQIKGTALDTQKTRQQLANIGRVLRGDFGKVGRDVRSAILQMFNDITSALEEGDSKMGPLTQAEGLNTKKILAGLGLSPEEIRQLRGRLSSVNTAGFQLAGAGAAQLPGGGFVGAPPIQVESHTTVNVDGQKVASVVTKQQQKSRRRNPRQKRGPNRRGSEG